MSVTTWSAFRSCRRPATRSTGQVRPCAWAVSMYVSVCPRGTRTPMTVTCGVARLPRTGKQITAGQRVAYVSEARHAPYVHDQHRADHGVHYSCWRFAMTGPGRIIRWSTAGAVVGVAAVAAVASYEHAYPLVRAHGNAGWTARPTRRAARCRSLPWRSGCSEEGRCRSGPGISVRPGDEPGPRTVFAAQPR